MTPNQESVNLLKYNTKFYNIFLALILLTGFFLRVDNLGTYGFWIDELFHVYAAKSLINNGSLFVPWVGEYTRALPVTYITAFAFKLFGESEFSARILFVITNVVFIFIGFFLVKKIFSKSIALLFVFIMSLSPFAIEMSRECRMYTLFQFAYFLMSVFFIQGFENNNINIKSKSKLPALWTNIIHPNGINYFFLFLSACFGVAALCVHKLTYNFVFVVLSYAILVLLYDIFQNSLRRAWLTKYSFIIGTLVVCFIFIFFFNKELLLSMMKTATNIPKWATYKYDDYSHYRWFLSDGYPALFFIYPISAFYLIKFYRNKGLFFVLSFLVLFLMHSYLFARKSSRYIFYIFPFFIIGATALLERILPILFNEIVKIFNFRSKWFSILIILLLLPSVNYYCYPWLSSLRSINSTSKHPDWKILFLKLKDELNEANVVISTNPRAFKYYFGRDPDYYFISEKQHGYSYDNGLIKNFDQLKNTVEMGNNVYLLCQKHQLYNDGYLNNKMSEYIEKNMHIIPSSPISGILIYKN